MTNNIGIRFKLAAQDTKSVVDGVLDMALYEVVVVMFRTSSGQTLCQVFGNMSWRVTMPFVKFSIVTARSGEIGLKPLAICEMYCCFTPSKFANLVLLYRSVLMYSLKFMMSYVGFRYFSTSESKLQAIAKTVM